MYIKLHHMVLKGLILLLLPTSLEAQSRPKMGGGSSSGGHTAGARFKNIALQAYQVMKHNPSRFGYVPYERFVTLKDGKETPWIVTMVGMNTEGLCFDDIGKDEACSRDEERRGRDVHVTYVKDLEWESMSDQDRLVIACHEANVILEVEDHNDYHVCSKLYEVQVEIDGNPHYQALAQNRYFKRQKESVLKLMRGTQRRYSSTDPQQLISGVEYLNTLKQYARLAQSSIKSALTTQDLPRLGSGWRSCDNSFMDEGFPGQECTGAGSRPSKGHVEAYQEAALMHFAPLFNEIGRLKTLQLEGKL